MKFRRFLLTLLVSILATSLGACAGSNEKDDDAQAQGKRLPAYFEEIPADTFFFVGGSEPVPPELIARGLEKLETVRKWGDEFNPGITPPGTSIGQSSGASEMERPPELLEFLLDKMGGEVSAEGLEKLGVSSSPRFAGYMVGVVPVMRVTLSDQKKFLAFIDDLEKTYDEPGTKLEHQKVGYRRYTKGGEHILMRTTADEAVFAFIEDDAVTETFLPYFVGVKKPQKSLADDNEFFRTVETNGFKRFGAGYLDLEQLIAYSTGTEKPQGITKAILDRSGFYMDESEQCKTEYMRLSLIHI